MSLNSGLLPQSNMAISAKAAATMVSWLQVEKDEHAAVAFLATRKVKAPVPKSWKHLVKVMCKAQQASRALEALQQLSCMGALPSTAAVEVFKALVNLVGGF